MRRKLTDGAQIAKLGADLIDAGFIGDFEEVKHLISEGADIKYKDHEGNTVFTEACLGGHYDIVIYLLSLKNIPGKKIDINYMN